MKALLFLGAIIGIYVYVYKKGYKEFTLRENVYFGIFVVGYVIIYYLLSYQKEFVYKLLSNVKHTDRVSKYDIQTLINTGQQKQVTVDPQNLRYLLATRQKWRCMSCSNPILEKDLPSYEIDYRVPPQYGGTNTLYNLGVKCSICKAYHHNNFDHNTVKFTGNHF